MGGTRYAVQRDLLVPSLVEPDWEFNGDLEGLRHYIFVGHGTGMPTWGVAGLTLREVDAVTHYLLDVLRPEVLAMGRRCFCGEGDPVRVIQEPREE